MRVTGSAERNAHPLCPALVQTSWQRGEAYGKSQMCSCPMLQAAVELQGRREGRRDMDGQGQCGGLMPSV